MRHIVLLSGGQDSTTVLHTAIRDAGRAAVTALTISYGQRHTAELTAAAHIAKAAQVAHEYVHLPEGVLAGTSPLVSGASLEQYADWQSLPGGLEKTFVPARNALFLTVAANRAYAPDGGRVWIGVSQEDNGGYPDCREQFITKMSQALRAGLDMDFGIVTPLIDMTKAATVRLAMQLPGCYAALGWSHTSYAGEYPPTDKNHANLLRAKGFEQAGVPDPLVARAVFEGLMQCPDGAEYTRLGDLLEAYGDERPSVDTFLAELAAQVGAL